MTARSSPSACKLGTLRKFGERKQSVELRLETVAEVAGLALCITADTGMRSPASRSIVAFTLMKLETHLCVRGVKHGKRLGLTQRVHDLLEANHTLHFARTLSSKTFSCTAVCAPTTTSFLLALVLVSTA